MTKFTPGPWDISGYDTTAVIVVKSGPDRDGREYVDGRHQYYVCHTDGRLPSDENEANARLIASAPDLYEALDSLLAKVDWENTGTAFEPDSGCLECTSGTTPDRLNTGPCAYHKAVKALSKANPYAPEKEL